jgi:hypothetical protein
MQEDNQKIIVEERTDRVLTIKFAGDFEYLHFIKILATSKHLNNVPHLMKFFEQSYEKISDNSDLNDMYNQIK